MALAWKGALAREHLVEHRPQRKNVAAAVQLFPLDLLGRHVLKRADDGALFGGG